MNMVRYLTANPAIVLVGIAIIFALGFLSLSRLPIQLLPNIERPNLGVQVSWRAASPREMESEIVIPIERELRGIPAWWNWSPFPIPATLLSPCSLSLIPTWIRPLPKRPADCSA